MGFIVHVFFAKRIYIITGSKWQTALTLLCALCAFVGALGTSIVALAQINMARFMQLPLAPMWLVGSAITDAIIASVFTYHLRKVKCLIACMFLESPHMRTATRRLPEHKSRSGQYHSL